MSNKLRKVSFLHSRNGDKSPSSEMEFEVRTRVVRFGTLEEIVGEMFSILFLPSSRVRSLRKRGRLCSCRISLSVRSIASF